MVGNALKILFHESTIFEGAMAYCIGAIINRIQSKTLHQLKESVFKEQVAVPVFANFILLASSESGYLQGFGRWRKNWPATFCD